MCGINGLWYFNQAEHTARESVRKMNLALQHRGPDNADIYQKENLTLGHARLSIIDLSEAGNQPFVRQHIALVFNGEIYNYRALKAELQNHYTFTTNSDTEVLAAAYLHWGIALLPKLRGMFAFAIFDAQQNKLFIARDRLGIKPLYYYHDNSKIAFSSELRALKASGVFNTRLNQNALYEYLRYQTVLAPQTLLTDVQMLMPGHYAVVTPQGIKTTEWYNVSKAAQTNMIPSRAEALPKVKQAVEQALEDRLVADVPVGAFLSGGIDSSLLVGVASELYNKKLDTFHISFAEKAFSEAKYAKIVADKFNTNHTDIQLSPSYFLEHLEEALQAVDYPSADGLNTYMVSKVTAQTGIKVALSGLGGDEVFAGYDIFKRAVSIEQNKALKAIPLWVRMGLGNVLKSIKPSVKSDKIAQVLSQEQFTVEYLYRFNREVLSRETVQPLLKTMTDITETDAVFSQLQAAFSTDAGRLLPTTGKVSLAEITTYLQNILLRDTDQFSMAHALEVRVPFLDHRLVELVIGLPDSYKLGVSNKNLLLDAFPNLLPESIFNRPKQGFTLPYEFWMRNELASFCDKKIEFLAQKPWFSQEGIRKLYNRFKAKDPRVGYSRIWHLVVLAHWLEQHGIE
ncbi:MAG: asparagine synthase (glutamine-hydrolyzing) [Luteibaculaceae bacterium]